MVSLRVRKDSVDSVFSSFHSGRSQQRVPFAAQREPPAGGPGSRTVGEHQAERAGAGCAPSPTGAACGLWNGMRHLLLWKCRED